MLRTILVIFVSCALATGVSAQTSAEVNIPDSNLRGAVEGALGKEAGAPITVAEMESLTVLSASGAGIADLTGLEHASGLTNLYLWYNQITDVTPLADLTALTSLLLYNNQISDVTALADLISLIELNLLENQITDVTPLASLTSLNDLNLDNNQISDVTALADMTALVYLGLQNNQIVDVTALADLTSLTQLWLQNNQIADVSALADMTSLTQLWLQNNQIADVTALAELTALTQLWLQNNQIADVTALAELTALLRLSLDNNQIADVTALADLTSLTQLNLGNNQITDVSVLADLTSLTHLYLWSNQITDVTALAELTSLTQLWLSNNAIADATPLADMTSLTTLDLVNNQIADVTPLADMTSLTQLYLSNNRIADVTPLADLTSLTWLWLGNNQITDVTPLADLTSLTWLWLGNNQITDVTPLADMTSLSNLWLQDNQIADVTPLADMTSLNWLWLGNNQITDVTPLADMTSLNFLSLYVNQIADVTPLADMTSLNWLLLVANQIVDVGPLAHLTSLVYLGLQNNQIADVTPLAGLTGLSRLGLGDNELVDVSPLTELSSLGWLGLWNNDIEDIGPLLDNPGLGAGDIVHVWRNPLNEYSKAQDIPALEDREARVIHAGHDVPFLPIAADAQRQGFVRIVNKTPLPVGGSLLVWNHAVDDTGDSRGASSMFLRAVQSAHFNSIDLEVGNPDKGITESVGAGEGGWRLELYPEDPTMDVEISAYMRTSDGFLTAMNALAPKTSDGYRIAFFNPGSNTDQVSTLRLANPGYGTANVTISGVDDLGAASAGSVQVAVAAGEARMLTVQQLESGDGVEGALGDGTGKWRLEVTTDAPLQAMSMLETPTGHLTNLSSIPDNATALTGGQTRHRISLFPAADDANGRQGFARVVNQGDAEASIQIEAVDDDGTRRGPVTLTVPAGATTHFNSGDLEGGNADKGLPSGTGSGTGDWRLELTSGADIEVLAYIRTTSDGFLTSMHDTVRGEEDDEGNHVYEVAIFNPASNTNQVSQLRVINDGSAAAQLTVTGTDDLGVASTDQTTVSFMLAAGDARTVTSQQLESGDEVTGVLGDGTGKWWLLVRSDRPIRLMNLLASRTGHLTNLSDARWRYQD